MRKLYLTIIFFILYVFSSNVIAKEIYVICLWNVCEKNEYMISTMDSLYFINMDSRLNCHYSSVFKINIPDSLRNGTRIQFEIYKKKRFSNKYKRIKKQAPVLYISCSRDLYLIRDYDIRKEDYFNVFWNLDRKFFLLNRDEDGYFSETAPYKVIPFNKEVFREYTGGVPHGSCQ
jgi:hypothetical protein